MWFGICLSYGYTEQTLGPQRDLFMTDFNCDWQAIAETSATNLWTNLWHNAHILDNSMIADRSVIGFATCQQLIRNFSAIVHRKYGDSLANVLGRSVTSQISRFVTFSKTFQQPLQPLCDCQMFWSQ